MARMSAPVTFESFTGIYTPKVLVDNIVVGTPGLDKLRKKMKPVEGKAWEPIVKLGTNSGEWYARDDKVGAGGSGMAGADAGSIASLSGDIADRAQYKLRHYRMRVLLPGPDVDMQGGLALVDMLKAYIDDGVSGANSDLSSALWASTSPTLTPNTLQHACDNVQGTEYGGLTPSADGTSWVSHMMEGETDGTYAFGTPVSPSLDNIGKQIRSIRNTCGQNNGPELVVVDEDYWDTLFGQLMPGENAAQRAAYANTDIVKWGYSALWCQDVPIISDRDCPGEAWVADQATRADAKGHEAFFLNFRSMNLAYNRKRAFKWRVAGWTTPDDYDGYLNFFYVWVTIGTSERRALGRQVNVCLDSDIHAVSDWRLGSMDVPA